MFVLFPKLPPEVRQEIWRCALEGGWSISRPSLRGQRLKLRGDHNCHVSQACREAHRAFRLVYTNVPGLGWFNMPRRLFFFRCLTSPAKPQLRSAVRDDLLPRIEHLVLNPRNWKCLQQTMDVVKTHCRALRTLVVVAPWFVPEPTDEYDPDVDWLAPWENWSEVSRDFPAGVNVKKLLSDIEHGVEVNGRWLVQYRNRLDLAVQRLPDPLPDHLELFDNVFWRTRHQLHMLEAAVRDMDLPGTNANLYLRKVDELRFATPPSSSNSILQGRGSL